ncbi:hypothetical protein [Gloeothece verrucosa]|uniref:Uncharacterized protein n=1 Tax=Gloeothece verrucosa (strain PCC 7822) TaxID=497965 RepID=E0UNB5_GLOV7|nr:hypothetical protein [Gloeothece verrucosa]ADN18445.1 hypothetical protein Cyan7822_6782 [Gloeothece verrucosa PCC 7822]
MFLASPKNFQNLTFISPHRYIRKLQIWQRSATYQFTTEDYTVTFYIHWDGYPEGAANYFLQMLLLDHERGSLADRFLRANPDAEITGTHDHHGDTEYRYTIICNQTVILKAESIDGFDQEEKAITTTIYQGDLANFINPYYSTNLLMQVIDDTPYQCLLDSLIKSLESIQTVCSKKELGQLTYPDKQALTIAQKMMSLNNKFGWESSWSQKVIVSIETLIQEGMDYLHSRTDCLEIALLFTLLEGIFVEVRLHKAEIQPLIFSET